MERSEGASKNCLHWEVRITVCYSDIACSCMTQWETPEVPCGCYACTECMFAMKSRCKYAGCRQPQSRTSTPAGVWAATRLLCKLLVRMSHFSVPCKLLVRMYWALRCGQPPAASLQAVGPYVLGLTGVCEQPPAASLQVVGPHVSELPCNLKCTRACCCCPCHPVVLLCVRRQG